MRTVRISGLDYDDGQRTLNIRNIDPEVVQAFRREAFERGLTHGELLAALVTERKGGQ